MKSIHQHLKILDLLCLTEVVENYEISWKSDEFSSNYFEKLRIQYQTSQNVVKMLGEVFKRLADNDWICIMILQESAKLYRSRKMLLIEYKGFQKLSSG